MSENQKNCIICETEFTGKENALYCSNACKQKAFRKGISKNTIINDTEQERNTFSSAEFKAVNDIAVDISEGIEHDFWIDNIITYCFLRRNLPKNFAPYNIAEYLKRTASDEFWEQWDNLNTELCIEIRNFTDLFNRGLITWVD